MTHLITIETRLVLALTALGTVCFGAMALL